MKDKMFETVDPLYNIVSCSSNRWNDHIADKHTELKNRHEEVAEVISSPESIYEAIHNLDEPIYRYVAASKNNGNGQQYIRAVVQVDRDSKKGELITAYTASTERGENIDENKKLYP